MKKVRMILIVTLVISFLSSVQVSCVKTEGNMGESVFSSISFTSKKTSVMSVQEFESIFSSGFEENVFPPAGWNQLSLNPQYSWHQDSVNVLTGNHSARCLYDNSSASQDEWIITPKIDINNHSDIYLSFNWFMSYFWSVEPYDNYDFNVYVSKGNDSNWYLVWNEEQFGSFENWKWYNLSDKDAIGLSEYCDQNFIQIAFQYIGTNGAQLNIDDIGVYGRRITNPPSVDAGGPYESYVGEEIEFFGNVVGGSSPFEWSWDFGDGYQSSQRFSLHTFDRTGTYIVRLQVKDANGIMDSDETTAIISNMSKVPELIIENITGPIGIHSIVSNKGCIDAVNVEWEIIVHGGLFNQIEGYDCGSISCIKQKCCYEIYLYEISGVGFVDVTVYVKANNMNQISRRCLGFLTGQYFLPITC